MNNNLPIIFWGIVLIALINLYTNADMDWGRGSQNRTGKSRGGIKILFTKMKSWLH